MPRFWRAHLALAVIYGQLGEGDEARSSLEQLLALKREFAASASAELAKSWDPELVAHLMDGLRKAGLEAEDAEDDEGPASANPPEKG